MFDDPHKRTFFSAPQSVQSLIAAFLEPGITVLTFIVITLASDEVMDRPALTLCLLVFALTFPGRDRFREPLLGAAVDIASSWVVLLAILALCAYATRSFHYFENDVLLAWAADHAGAAVARDLARARRSSGAGRPARSRGARRSSSAPARSASRSRARCRAATTAASSSSASSTTAPTAASTPRRRPRSSATLAEVAAYTTEHGVREVYITLPLGSQPRIVELLEQLQGTTASLFFVPDVFGISIIQGRLQDMNGVPVVGICETPFTGTNELVKRISDIVIASVILVLISPLLLAIAIGVKLSSPGPVLFKQRRNGLDGHEIVVYKFRSMRTMDDGDVVRQATRNDPRVTPFGAFLRRTSLDELPQFFNVLQGTMSIVGPRPHAVTHNKEYRQIIKAYMVRHKVKPGHHRLGPGERPARRDRHGREDAGAGRIRSRVSAQLVAGARPEDHREHDPAALLRPPGVLKPAACAESARGHRT